MHCRDRLQYPHFFTFSAKSTHLLGLSLQGPTNKPSTHSHKALLGFIFGCSVFGNIEKSLGRIYSVQDLELSTSVCICSFNPVVTAVMAVTAFHSLLYLWFSVRLYVWDFQELDITRTGQGNHSKSNLLNSQNILLDTLALGVQLWMLILLSGVISQAFFSHLQIR